MMNFDKMTNLDGMVMNFDGLLYVLLIMIGTFIIIYIGYSIFLNNLNKMICGKDTILAWIPICNIYLLGKLAINKIIGWFLIILLFLTIHYEIYIFHWIFLIVFLVANAKYNKLKKAEKAKSK